jgi:hypothetical protein
VAKINRDLVAFDEEGKPYTVRYEAVNAMLLNEFLKEHRKVEEQEATIIQLKSDLTKQGVALTRQEKRMEGLTVLLKEQAAQIQKVSAELEATKPSPRLVVSNE